MKETKSYASTINYVIRWTRSFYPCGHPYEVENEHDNSSIMVYELEEPHGRKFFNKGHLKPFYVWL